MVAHTSADYPIFFRATRRSGNDVIKKRVRVNSAPSRNTDQLGEVVFR